MIAVKILIVSGLLIIGPELCQQTKSHDSPPPKTPSPGRQHISTEHSPRHPPPPSPANHRNELPVASSHKDHPSHSGPLSPSPIGGSANHRPPPKKNVQEQPARDHHHPQKVHMNEQSPVKDPRSPGSKPPFTPRPMGENMLSPKKSIPGSPLKRKADSLSMDSNIRPADPVPVKPANTKRSKGLSRAVALAPLEVYKYTEKKWTPAECLTHCENTVGYVDREKQLPIFISKGVVDSYNKCNCGLNVELIDFLKTNKRNSTAFEEAFSKNNWAAARSWLTLQNFTVSFPITEYYKWDPIVQKQVRIVHEEKKNDGVTPKKSEKGAQKQSNPNPPKGKDAVTPE